MLTAGGAGLGLALSKLVPISIVVAVLIFIVVASYRQTIFAYPQGGGSYMVSRDNLGKYPSLVAGASLLVDYILTVAVSISAGVAAIVSLPAFRGLAEHRVGVGIGLILLITVLNLRGLKESGSPLRRPRLHLHRQPGPADRLRADPELLRGPRPRPAPRTGRRLPWPAHRWEPRPAPPAEGLLVGRSCPQRDRGHRRWRSQLQEEAVGGQERGRHPGNHGHHPGDPVRGRLGAGPPPVAVPERARDGDLPDGPRRLRRGALLRHPPVRHRLHLDPRRQHRLRRLPAAVVDHRPRRLPAPAVHEHGRPPGVLQRRGVPGRRRRRAAGGLRRGHQRPDPALRGRRLHLLHPQPDRHGQAAPQPQRSRLEARDHDQRRRCGQPRESC